LQVTAKVTDGLTLMGSLSNNDAKQTNSRVHPLGGRHHLHAG
jgi:hypothetical protein